MELVQFTGNVGLALLLGLLIGLERELTHHPAGLRTNGLVAVGAALFASLNALVADPGSPTRVVANIVVGVGFLGGGVILKEGMNIRGLTTAAGVWCSAAVGTLSGLGLGLHAVIGTGFILLVLVGFHPIDHWLAGVRQRITPAAARYRVRVCCGATEAEAVRAAWLRQLGAIPGVKVSATKSQKQSRKRVLMTAEFGIRPAHDAAVRELVDRLTTEPGVVGASWEQLPQA